MPLGDRVLTVIAAPARRKQPRGRLTAHGRRAVPASAVELQRPGS
jgi:hypothetical protein